MSLRAWLCDLLYPRKCVFCRRLLEKEEPDVCPACRAALPRPPLGERRRAAFLSGLAAPLYYEGTVRDSLRRYKFGGVTCYAAPYAALMAESVRASLTPPFDVISWAPLSRKRLRRRGYDQSRLLAEALSRELSLPCAPLLEKHRDAPPQSRAGGKAARQANISGCYAVRDTQRAGRARILLVDDIVTTAATLSECARMLLLSGAADVQAVTVACARDDR